MLYHKSSMDRQHCKTAGIFQALSLSEVESHMNANPPDAKRLKFFCDILFVLSLAAVVIFILRLPLFPNSDGSVHLYYAHVMWSLVNHQPLYEHFYAIRHLIGVYSIHYFALILFENFVSPAKAEELFIAIILVNSALGFRFLAGRLGANSAVVSLWMVPLLLSWPLGAGFLNYCFAIGAVCWALGFWIGLPPEGKARGVIGFSVAVVAMIFSHPVPLLFLVIFLTADLLLRWMEERRSNASGFFRRHSARLAAFGLTCLAILVPSILVQKGQIVSDLRDIYPHPHLLRYLLEGRYVGMFGGGYPLQILYTIGVLFVIPGVALLMAKGPWTRLRQGKTTAADRLLVFSILFLVATLSFPDSLNGADNFPQRFWILLWMMILACGAAATVKARALGWIAAGGGLLIVITGTVAMRTMPGVARMQAVVSHVRLPSGSKGIFLEPWGRSPYDFGLTGNVFYSVGFRAAAQSDAIILNSPWIYQEHMPIRENGRSGLIADYVSWYSSQPPRLLKIVSTPSPTRDAVLRASDFFLLADPWKMNGGLVNSVRLILRDEQPQWSCKYGKDYVMCQRVRKREQAGSSLR